MRATVVTNDGTVCQVSKTGEQINDQWLGSRPISAQKAYIGIAFSTPKFALSSANLFTALQPGNSLFGLQHSNPEDSKWAYRGNSNKFGNANDPMKGHRAGGINVFGGELVGALGVSGDTSCADS